MDRGHGTIRSFKGPLGKKPSIALSFRSDELPSRLNRCETYSTQCPTATVTRLAHVRLPQGSGSGIDSTSKGGKKNPLANHHSPWLTLEATRIIILHSGICSPCLELAPLASFVQQVPAYAYASYSLASKLKSCSRTAHAMFSQYGPAQASAKRTAICDPQNSAKQRTLYAL